jgi:hypothetical protein
VRKSESIDAVIAEMMSEWAGVDVSLPFIRFV